MAKLRLKSKVLHPPGFWGVNRPVAGATVKIVDIDAPGRSDDVIWQGTTDANGAFQGESADWQDAVTITPGVPATPFTPGVPAIVGPDPTDVMMLQILISQDTPGGHKQVALPFTFLGDGIASPPSMVTWGPSEAVVKVNGTACHTPNDVQSNVRSSAQHGDGKITIDVYGPDASALAPLALPADQLRQWLQQQRSQVSNFVDPPSWAIGTFVILCGVAILCLAIGATAVLFAIGVAIILAVAMGYRNIKVEQKTDAQTGQNYIRFELVK